MKIFKIKSLQIAVLAGLAVSSAATLSGCADFTDFMHSAAGLATDAAVFTHAVDGATHDFNDIRHQVSNRRQ